MRITPDTAADRIPALARILLAEKEYADGAIDDTDYRLQVQRFITRTSDTYSDALAAILTGDHASPDDMHRTALAGWDALAALDARVIAATAPSADAFEVRVLLRVGTTYERATAIAEAIECAYDEATDKWGVFAADPALVAAHAAETED